MPLKTSKCCCGPCPQRCVTHGQILDECSLHGETPGYYQPYQFVPKGTPLCCSISTLAKVANQCLWKDEGVGDSCDDSSISWTFDLAEKTLCGVRGVDGLKICYKARGRIDPLCVVNLYYDAELSTYECYPHPKVICLFPSNGCCDQVAWRDEPMPRTLHCTVISSIDMPGFDCQFDPPLSWEIEWNPENGWWQGSSPTIEGESLTARLWCKNVIGGGTVNDFVMMVNGYTADVLDGVCEPLYLSAPLGVVTTFCDNIDVAVTE